MMSTQKDGQNWQIVVDIVLQILFQHQYKFLLLILQGR